MEVNSLTKDGFVLVKYPHSLRDRVQEAMDSWQNFCNLTSKEKQKLSGGDRLHDFGYMRRNDKGPRADRKEIFHVLREVVEELRTKAAGIKDRRAILFIEAIDVLLRESVPLVQKFARGVEKHYSIRGFEKAVMSSQNSWVFRYLHYFGGETLAHPHADRGGFTLHLHESHEGGEYLGFDGKWRPWPVSPKETIIFPSMGLQHHSEGKLKALWHRVEPTRETIKQGRHAMVAFIEFRQGHYYDGASKRLQDFDPGFNYQIPFVEFNKLFLPKIKNKFK